MHLTGAPIVLGALEPGDIGAFLGDRVVASHRVAMKIDDIEILGGVVGYLLLTALQSHD